MDSHNDVNHGNRQNQNGQTFSHRKAIAILRAFMMRDNNPKLFSIPFTDFI